MSNKNITKEAMESKAAVPSALLFGNRASVFSLGCKILLGYRVLSGLWR